MSAAVEANIYLFMYEERNIIYISEKQDDDDDDERHGHATRQG